MKTGNQIPFPRAPSVADVSERAGTPEREHSSGSLYTESSKTWTKSSVSTVEKEDEKGKIYFHQRGLSPMIS